MRDHDFSASNGLPISSVTYTKTYEKMICVILRKGTRVFRNEAEELGVGKKVKND